MDTPQDQANSYREAEETETKYAKVSHDPQFDRMMDLMLKLQEKYGDKRLRYAILEDYRERNWIHLLEL